MNKAYLISVGTALALGYTAGFASNSIDAKASVNKTESHVVSKQLSPAAKTTIENYIQAQACAEVDAEYDLEGELACKELAWPISLLGSSLVDRGPQDHPSRSDCTKGVKG